MNWEDLIAKCMFWLCVWMVLRVLFGIADWTDVVSMKRKKLLKEQRESRQ